MWGTQNKVLSQLSKEIWDYLIKDRIMITAECLLGALNKEVDFQSQNVKDSASETQTYFKKFVIGGEPQIWIFLHLECLPKCLSSLNVVEATHLQQRLECFSDLTDSHAEFAFPPFSLIGRVLKKIFLITNARRKGTSTRYESS